MDIEANKQLIRDFVCGVVNTGNFDRLGEFVAEEIIDHNAGPDQLPGISGYREHLRGVRTTFPDFQLTIEMQIAEGDLVVTQVTGHGTHQGAWLGIAPQGSPVVVTGINIDRIANDRIVEHWGEANTIDMLLQLGMRLVPGDAAS